MTGYSLSGRKDVVAPVREALDPFSSRGVREFTFDAGVDTDNFDFLIEGVPTLVGIQDPANYMLNYHAASDTFDKVDIAELKRHSESPPSPPSPWRTPRASHRTAPIPRRDRTTPARNRPRSRTCRKAGFWPLWEKSVRGRQP